ncbi:MAG: peptidoglycan DD-metalloendopeptidase family protein [Mucilaginibacter polytrichastri]|nr:peptidoglycan DD-metalloendopeptidase family protein [Mucilaginibacter polytrichastri]
MTRKIFFTILFLAVAGFAFAQSSAELKKKKDQLNREIELLNRDLRETSSEKRSSLKELNTIKAQIRLREEKIKTINSEVRLLDNQISENTGTVRSLQLQLNQLKKDYAAMIVFAFRNKSAYNKMMFIFAAKDFNQAYKRLKYLQQFGDYRQRQAQYISGTQKNLNEKIVELDKDKKEKNNLLSDQEKEKKNLGVARTKQDDAVKQLSKKERATRQELVQSQRELRKLNASIASAIRREVAAAKRKAEEEARKAAAAAAAKTGSTEKATTTAASAKKAAESTSAALRSTPEAAKLSDDFNGNRGRLPWPVASISAVVNEFGINTIEGIRTESNGIDIRTGSGATVRAVFDGTVSQVSEISGRAFVLIRHGEFFTVYSNLKSASVSSGQKVSTKQAIGTAATDPATGDTEVHFELHKAFTPQNPRNWLAN